MNKDTFEGSETVDAILQSDAEVTRAILESPDHALSERASDETIRERVRALTMPSSPVRLEDIDPPLTPPCAGDDPLDRDLRLKRCGLVHYDRQVDSHRWVAPPGTYQGNPVKILPLFMVKPEPGLEITATDGEKYILPADFKGDWFDIRSPKGRELIP